MRRKRREEEGKKEMGEGRRERREGGKKRGKGRMKKREKNVRGSRQIVGK